MKHESALTPSNYSDRKKENRRTSDTTFDRIYKYYHSSKTRIELTEEEEEIRIRWESAWFLLVRAKSMKDVADEMEKIHSISKSVAYDDVRHAMNLFGGDPRQNLKPAKRAIAESIALKGLEYAEKSGNLIMMDAFLQKYIDINGLKDKGGNATVEDLIKNRKPAQVVLTSKKEDLQKDAQALYDTLVKAMSSMKRDEGES